jgi:peroxiredoxin Q/BCP
MLTDRITAEPDTSAPSVARPLKPRRSPATKLFLAFMGFVALAYFALIAYRASGPPAPSPIGDIAADARAYLAAARAEPTPQPPAESRPVTGQSHPLFGKTAPDFDLTDTKGQRVALRDLRRDGPVIVVFYYGYYCSHCVAQLFALEDDLPKFTLEGVHIVAMSADAPNETAARFRQYGRFHYPVLSDPDNQVAERYGVYTRATANRDQDLKHGTFLVDRNGQIVWAYAGDRPFVDNTFLLNLIASQRERPRTAQRNASFPQSQSNSSRE